MVLPKNSKQHFFHISCNFSFAAFTFHYLIKKKVSCTALVFSCIISILSTTSWTCFIEKFLYYFYSVHHIMNLLYWKKKHWDSSSFLSHYFQTLPDFLVLSSHAIACRIWSRARNKMKSKTNTVFLFCVFSLRVQPIHLLLFYWKWKQIINLTHQHQTLMDNQTNQHMDENMIRRKMWHQKDFDRFQSVREGIHIRSEKKERWICPHKFFFKKREKICLPW